MTVSGGYLREHGIASKDGRIDALSSPGKTMAYVLIDGDLRGAVALADIIRPESSRAISRLKEMGVQTMMLTGDNERVARWVAEEVGLDDYFAQVLPDEKAEKVKEVQRRGLVVAVTSDGVNAAPLWRPPTLALPLEPGPMSLSRRPISFLCGAIRWTQWRSSTYPGPHTARWSRTWPGLVDTTSSPSHWRPAVSTTTASCSARRWEPSSCRSAPSSWRSTPGS